MLVEDPPFLPPGTYGVLYFDSRRNRIETEHSKITIGAQAQTKPRGVQMSLPGLPQEPAGASSSPPSVKPGIAANVRRPPKPESTYDKGNAGFAGSEVGKEANDDQEDLSSSGQDSQERDEQPHRRGPPSIHAERVADLELQMRMARQEQDFVRQSIHTKEVGETHQLNSFIRKDLVVLAHDQTLAARELSRAMAHSVTLNAQTMTQVSEMMREHMLSTYELIQARITAAPPAPPPPPDIAGAIAAGVSSILQFGAQVMMHREDMARLSIGQPSALGTPSRLRQGDQPPARAAEASQGVPRAADGMHEQKLNGIDVNGVDQKDAMSLRARLASVLATPPPSPDDDVKDPK